MRLCPDIIGPYILFSYTKAALLNPELRTELIPKCDACTINANCMTIHKYLIMKHRCSFINTFCSVMRINCIISWLENTLVVSNKGPVIANKILFSVCGLFQRKHR